MVDDPPAALGASTDRIDRHLEPRDGVPLKGLRQIIPTSPFAAPDTPRDERRSGRRALLSDRLRAREACQQSQNRQHHRGAVPRSESSVRGTAGRTGLDARVVEDPARHRPRANPQVPDPLLERLETRDRRCPRRRRRIGRGDCLRDRVPRDPQLPGDMRLRQPIARVKSAESCPVFQSDHFPSWMVAHFSSVTSAQIQPASTPEPDLETRNPWSGSW